MKTVSLKLPPELDNQLEKLAQERNTTRSALVREALVAYVSQSQYSALDAMRDLVGCLDGPPDLSVNPAYMNQYGR